LFACLATATYSRQKEIFEGSAAEESMRSQPNPQEAFTSLLLSLGAMPKSNLRFAQRRAKASMEESQAFVIGHDDAPLAKAEA